MHLLVSENEAEEWPQEAEWKLPMEDFHKREPAEFHRCRELTHILCQDSPKIFPRREQIGQRSTNVNKSLEKLLSLEWFEKTCNEDSRLAPKSFQNHQNDDSLVAQR